MEPWKKLEESLVFDGRQKVLERLFTVTDGRQVPFQVKLEPNVVFIFALDPEQNVILIRQFRPGPEVITWEVPAGRIDPGEESSLAAERELREETGYTGNIQKLFESPIASYSTSKATFFVATDCERIAHQHLDQNEFIEVVVVSLAECREMIRSGKICGLSSTAIYSALDHLHLL